MIKKINKNKLSLLLVLGIPLCLLLLSIVILKENNNSEAFVEKVNMYLPKMPNTYSNAIVSKYLDKNIKLSDSALKAQFHTLIIETTARKELLILKVSPNKTDLSSRFAGEIYLSDNSELKSEELILKLNTVSKPILYNFNNLKVAVFKTVLPLLEIDKIEIKQQLRNKKIKTWNKTITNPSSEINYRLTDFKELPSKIRYEPSIYKSLLTHTLKENNISVVNYGYIINNDTLFETQIERSDYFTKTNDSWVIVKNPKAFWNSINLKDKNASDFVELHGPKKQKITELLDGLQNNKLEFSSVFNSNKLAVFKAILAVFSNECLTEDIVFVYNKELNKLDPVFNYKSCIGKTSKFIIKPIVEDKEFIEDYMYALADFSEHDFIKDLQSNPNIIDNIFLINSHYPNKIFDSDYIKINQNKIKKSLNQSTIIKSELISINEKRMVVSVYNPSYYPVKIFGLNHKQKKDIVEVNAPVDILSGHHDTISFDLPRSFENLFVSKKKKITGFRLHKDIYDLYISFSVGDFNNRQLASIIPYQEKEFLSKDLFRNKEFIGNHENFVINTERKIATFNKDSITISTPLIIPKGYTFTLRSGMKINIVKGGKIISHSPLNFTGNKQNPIKVYSSDKKGQGMLVLAEGLESNLRFVEFNNLTNPKHGTWSVTGAVTFYESPVKLNHVSVKNNSCEDALNIVRTNFTMRNCEISDTQSDAFDGDFVNGTISESKFYNLGNDGIDVSGSDLKIINVLVNKAGDKGLSAGEDSKMTIKNVEVSDSEIAVAGKDLSIVNITDLKIVNTKLAFTAFQKKPEFGPSHVKVVGVTMENVETKYLIESSSTLFVDGEKIETSQNVKDRMYGVEFGVSSAETRNSQ